MRLPFGFTLELRYEETLPISILTSGSNFFASLLPGKTSPFFNNLRQDSTDGKAATSYSEDPGSNPVVGMKNMRHAVACLT